LLSCSPYDSAWGLDGRWETTVRRYFTVIAMRITLGFTFTRRHYMINSASDTSHEHQWSRAHIDTSLRLRYNRHMHNTVSSSHGQSCSRAHCNTARCPPAAANSKRSDYPMGSRAFAPILLQVRVLSAATLIPSAAVVPRPLQHLHIRGLRAFSANSVRVFTSNLGGWRGGGRGRTST